MKDIRKIPLNQKLLLAASMCMVTGIVMTSPTATALATTTTTTTTMAMTTTTSKTTTMTMMAKAKTTNGDSWPNSKINRLPSAQTVISNR